MNDIDKRIESMGYEVRVSDLQCGYIVYENRKFDQEIIIEWDDDDDYCKVLSRTISREKDWFGHTHQMPMPLNLIEVELFTTKINEMRSLDENSDE